MSRSGWAWPVAQVSPEEITRQRARLLPPYKVILLNDEYHEMDYVVAVLLHLISHLTYPDACQIMYTAHLTGSAVVTVCPKEQAEFYQERLLGYGLGVTIEPE